MGTALLKATRPVFAWRTMTALDPTKPNTTVKTMGIKASLQVVTQNTCVFQNMAMYFKIPGCKDIYHANIDCQWIDVSELNTGTYLFKMAINPEFKVAEKTFENNVALCTLIYTQQYASVSNCSYTRP